MGRGVAARRLLTTAAVLLLAAVAGVAGASIFDAASCRVFGCAFLTNGTQWELYLLEGSGGREATLWTTGAGLAVEAVETGTLRPPRRPAEDQGSPVGIDSDGDGTADLFLPGPGTDGFLDAGGRVASVRLDPSTDVDLAEREIRHSFYLAANGPLTIRARARLGDRRGGVGERLDLGSVEIEVTARADGADGGLTFGGASTLAGFRPNPAVRTLADLAAAPVPVFELEEGTVAGPAGSLERHLVRVDCSYRLPPYDLSQGEGEAEIEIEYLLYN